MTAAGTRSGGRGVADDASAMLFARQVQAAARAAPLANIAHAVAFVFVGTVILPTVGTERVLWIVAGVLLCLLTLSWRLARPADPHRVQREMLMVTVLFGGLWTVATAWVVLEGQRIDQILLPGMVAGVLGAGAVALSTRRVVGLTWIAAMSIGPLALWVSQADPTLLSLAVLLVIYDVAMVIGVLHLASSFRARCMAEAAAEAGQADLQVLLDDFEAGAKEWLWETDGDGRFCRVSERFAQMAEVSADGLRAHTLLTLLQLLRADEYPEGRSAVAALSLCLRRGEPFSGISVPVRVGRERRWWSLSGKARSDGHWRGLGADLTEAVLAQQRIQRLATTDLITGLPNREALHRELLTRLERSGTACLHLGIIDIDNFKAVNDTLGHPAGDRLITQIAATLAQELGVGEFCARFGGDEFAVVLADEGSATVAAARFAALHRALKEQDYPVDGNLLAITSSIGVASSDDAAGDIAGLISYADLALYAAKADGRDQVQFWKPQLSESANRRAQLVQDITRGIEAEQFETYWQPQIDLADGSVVGLEALIRWNHPRLGVLTPSQFLQVATESGLIVRMGRHSLEEALDAAAAGWSGDLRISINVSARELLSAEFVQHLLRRVAVAGVAPQRIVVEVTEDVLLNEEALQAVMALGEAGFALSMDDFGTGYSSFALLATLRFDEIKIDRSFIRPLTEDPVFHTLVRTVIDMARALGARVVAEGVETTAQRDVLTALGCHTFQGFLEARPAPRGTVERYLNHRVES